MVFANRSLSNFPLTFATNFVHMASALFLVFIPHAFGLSDDELEQVRAGFDERRDEYLTGYLDHSFYDMDEGMSEMRTAIASASWIWHPESQKGLTTPIGKRFFRKSITLPDSPVLKNAHATFAGDNFADIEVNGHRLGSAHGFNRATLFDLSPHLKKGTNVLRITAHNVGDEPNPAGLLGVIHLHFEDGTSTLLPTDSTWRVNKQKLKDWNTVEFDDSSWQASHVLGPSDIAPWGTPVLNLEGQVIRYAFSRLTFALAALYLGTETDLANRVIIESTQKIQEEHQATGEFGLHWMGGTYHRLYGLFGPDGTQKQRMSNQAANAIRNLYADWAQDFSKIADADPEKTWRIWGSENHSAQRDATLWATAQMIATHPMHKNFRYADGSTAQEQLVAWETFMKRYYRERIKRGMLVEISPSGYGSRTMQGWHNIADFSHDIELRLLAKLALDVWWTEWAQEQLGGMRGGGKTRLYKGAYALSHSDRNRAMGWFYFGMGKIAHQHETLPVIATTEYRPPLVVMDIALDAEGRGSYENQSRRLGRHEDYALSQQLSKPNEPVYTVDAEYGGILKYSWCTPDFIMGTLMLENRPKEYWTAISQQNRWHGVIFSGAEDSTLYPRCDTERSHYNEQWSVQRKGTLIVQKLRHSDQADAMRVFFSSDLKRHEEGDWVFAEAAQAFAAVRVVEGSYQWADKRWLQCENEFRPIIIEVVRKQDFNYDFSAFKKAILQQSIDMKKGVLHYSGLNDSGEFTFYTQSEQVPEINGAPINFAPSFTFKSPFIQEEWASGLVRITKGERESIIDLRD